MRMFGKLMGVVLGAAIIVGVIVGVYYFFIYIVSVFGVLGRQAKTITAIASVVAILCAIIISGGMKAWSQKDKDSVVTMEKLMLYQKLIMLLGDKVKNVLGAIDEQSAAELGKFERLLALHGGAKVIKA